MNRIRQHITYPAAVRSKAEATPGKRIRGDAREWSDIDSDTLEALYATTDTAKLAVILGRTELAVKSRANIMALVKRPVSAQRQNQSRRIGVQRQFGFEGA